MQPEIAAAILRAFAILRDGLSEAQLARLIASGELDQLLRDFLSDDVMARAFIPLRQRIRFGVERQLKYFAADLPKAGKVDGVLAIAFDYLNPRVLDAIRALDTKVIQTLADDVREAVRAYVENGIRDGANPHAVARQIRHIIGLAPNQERAVRNYERALRGTNPNAKPGDYKLRDRRYDTTKGPLTEAQIETRVAAYRRKMVDFNASTNARTAALDAMKLGQRLSWEDAIEKGIVDRDRLFKQWIGVMDDRERPEHREMEKITVHFDEAFPEPSGEMIPGESTYNCRCIPRYFVARSA